jgi:hypothetical protein
MRPRHPSVKPSDEADPDCSCQSLVMVGRIRAHNKLSASAPTSCLAGTEKRDDVVLDIETGSGLDE